MITSLPRKVLASAVAVAAPLAIVAGMPQAGWQTRVLALAITLIAAAIVVVRAGAVARHVDSLTEFVEHLLDPDVANPPAPPGDDELARLTRSLSRMAPRVKELVGKLSTELMRREAVLASLTEAVLAVDAQMTVTFCNRSFVQAAGDHGLTEGVPLIRIIRDPGLFRVLKRVLDTGQPVRERLQLFVPEGHTFEVNAAPLANSTSRGAIAILHDVSPAERLERVKRDFIANVSHEFRTPLATIRGYAETLLDGGLEDEENRRKFVEVIHANGVRLNNIAADLLTLSELEGGRPEPQPGPISVADAVNGAIHAVEPAARLRGLRLLIDPIPDVAILGYGIRFEQALLNLLDNAVKFNRENGEVRVRIRSLPDGFVEIRVSDTGVGIPPEDLSRIFERFYRVDKARSRQVGGTGLGLSIVRHAIEQMGGRITVQSDLDNGSSFTITLPRFAPNQ